MDDNTKKENRSLSDEFYARSPNSQSVIKGWTSTTPTSKYKKATVDDASIIEYYNNLDPKQQELMIQYGMLNPRQIMLCKKTQ
jgi:hypothetical protein